MTEGPAPLQVTSGFWKSYRRTTGVGQCAGWGPGFQNEAGLGEPVGAYGSVARPQTNEEQSPWGEDYFAGGKTAGGGMGFNCGVLLLTLGL